MLCQNVFYLGDKTGKGRQFHDIVGGYKGKLWAEYPNKIQSLRMPTRLYMSVPIYHIGNVGLPLIGTALWSEYVHYKVTCYLQLFAAEKNRLNI